MRIWPILLTALFILVSFIIVIYALDKYEESTDECIKLGCEKGSNYVGSITSDKYYECDCRYARNINPENIICFKDDEEAVLKGRVKSEC